MSEPRGGMAAYMRERRARHRTIRDQAKASGCADCGRRDGRIAFHHVDPATKRQTVGLMMGYAAASIQREIEKCVVLCNRCHAKRHGSGRL
jgi:hypothetical protein